MNRDELIENLRTTLLWETVCAHIEHGNEANVILQKVGVENGVTAECAEIQDSEDFFVTDVCESGGRIVIDFEMLFILCANNKYHIEAMAAGKLDIPNPVSYPYDSYDFAAMGKKELLSFGGIVSISSITYSDVELLDMLGEKIGDDAIDDAFDAVSTAIGDTVWEKFGEFIDRQCLDNELAVCDELFDMIKRDMAWACVEKILDMPGFFTMLAEIYKEGYFSCSWNGEYPFGQAVVL